MKNAMIALSCALLLAACAPAPAFNLDTQGPARLDGVTTLSARVGQVYAVDTAPAPLYYASGRTSDKQVADIQVEGEAVEIITRSPGTATVEVNGNTYTVIVQ